VAMANGANYELYLNGVRILSSPGFFVNSPARPLNRISTYNGVNQTAFGLLDEVRISTVTRSSNWVWTAHQNSAFSDTFNAFDPVEVVPTNPPVIDTLPPTNPSNEGADLNGRLIAAGSSTSVVWVYYGTVDRGTNVFAWEFTNTFGAHPGGVPFDYTFTATSLTPNVEYVYRYVVTNSFGAWVGEPRRFTVLGPPIVDNQSGATGLGVGTATFSGGFQTDNRGDVTFYYGLTDGGTTPGNWDASVNLGVENSATFSSNVGGLFYGATYAYRTSATNSEGIGWAASSTNFKTLRPAGVGLNNTFVDGLSDSTAVIHATAELDASVFQVQAYWGTVNGGTNSFAWSNTTSLGWFTNVSSTNLSLALIGLATNTFFYWTFRMTNCAEELWAQPARTFRTLGGSPGVDNDGGASYIIAGGSDLNARLIDGGSAEVRIYFGTSDGGTIKSAWEQSASLGVMNEGPGGVAVTGLTYGVRYYYRAYATNAFGEGWATNTAGFKTRPPLLSPEGMSGIELWLDASRLSLTNDSIVNVWPDRSGHGNHIDVMPGVESDPRFVASGVNRQPMVRYDGDDMHHTTRNFIDLRAHTLFGVARYTDTTGLPTGGRIFTTVGGNWLFGFWNGQDETYFAEGWIHTTGTANTNWHLHVGTMTGDADPLGAFWKDGILLATNNAGSGLPATPRQFAIGGWQNNLNESAASEVSEFIMFNRVLSPGEIDRVAGYLSARYDLNNGYDGAPAGAVQPLPVSGITSSSAVLSASFTGADAVFHVSAWWGTNDGGTNAVAWSNSVSLGTFTNLVATNFSLPLNGLATNTTYAFAFRITNCAESTWVEPSGSFTTLGGAPTVDHGAGVTELQAGRATLNGRLTAGVQADVTVYYGTSDGGTNRAAWASSVLYSNVFEGPLELPLSGLFYGEAYYYRVYATNAFGLGWAPVTESFKTPAPVIEPSSIDGLDLWLNASTIGSNDNDVVDFWPDDSGRGHHIDNLSGAGSDPHYVADGRNGQPLVRYDGNDFHYTTHSFHDLGDHTVFSVARYTDPWGLRSRRIITSQNRNWLFGYWGANDERFFADGWIQQTGTPNTNWHLHAGTMSDDLDPVASFWKDGVNLTTNNAGSAPPHAPLRLSLGAWQNNVNESSEPEVSEVLIFDRVLTGREFAMVNGYLENKYALGTSYTGFSSATIVHTMPANVTETSAVLQAEIDIPGAVYSVEVFWDTMDRGTNAAMWAQSGAVGVFTNLSGGISHPVGGLTADIDYFYAFRMTNCLDVVWARPSASFKTVGAPPMVDNLPGVGLIDASSADLQGNLTAGGAAFLTIYFGTSDGGAVKSAWDQALFIDKVNEGAFAHTVSGLLYGATYYYRSYVTNAVGEDWADSTEMFKTPSPATPSLPVTDRMTLWLKADAIGSNDNDSVHVWIDDSGNGNPALQTNGTARPVYIDGAVNGLPAVRFDGDDRMVFNPVNARTIFIVTRPDVLANDLDGLIGFQCCAVGIRRGGNNFWRHGSGSDVNDFSNPLGSSFRLNDIGYTANAFGPEQTWQIVEAVRGLGHQQHDAIGGYFPNRDYNGDIAEVIVYDRPLTLEERDAVGTYLAEKYAIPNAYSGQRLFVENRPASNVTQSSAEVAGGLAGPQSVFDVTLFYGETDGGTNASAWSNAVSVGSFTNADQMIGASLSGLPLDTEIFYTFRATNCAETIWAAPSLSFKTFNNANRFSHRAKVTFCGYGQSETLVDFPALVTLSTNIPGFDYSRFASITGGDLRFFDAGLAVELTFEIETWNTNGDSHVWVQVPSIVGSSSCVYAVWGSAADVVPPAYTMNGG
ncbi:MAG: hypothetical protein AAF492_00540, partial [Verrucomicrobiota bacterium]